MEIWKNKMLEHINKKRLSYQLHPLELDNHLCNIAHQHVLSMNHKNKIYNTSFTHQQVLSTCLQDVESNIIFFIHIWIQLDPSILLNPKFQKIGFYYFTNHYSHTYITYYCE